MLSEAKSFQADTNKKAVSCFLAGGFSF